MASAPAGPGLLGLILDPTLQAKKHNLTVNLTTFRVWCYACEREVFLEQRLAVPRPGSPPRFSEQVSTVSLWSLTLLGWGPCGPNI